MKKMKCMKLYALVLLLLVCCVLSACSQPTNATNDNSGANYSDELDYTLSETNGEWHLVFDDISVYTDGEKSDVCTLSFGTIKEMKNAIKSGSLKGWQKKIVATAFDKDQAGVKVPDLEKLYAPKIPAAGVVDCVIWSGESYSFSVTLDENIFGMLHVYTAEQYANVFASDYEGYFEKDTITVLSTETLDGGVSVTYYSTNAAQLMQVRYILTEGNKTLTVDKTYRYTEENADAEGNYNLTNVTIYCEDGGKKYVADLFGFAEEPTDAWLLTFDLSEYKDDGSAVS